MKNRILFCVYLAVQLAVFVLLPIGLLLRIPLCLYIASPLAFVAIVFLVVFLKKSGGKQK